MPTLSEFLNQVQFISQEAILLGLFLTAGIILVGRDWRFLITALLTQYILVGLMLTRLVRPEIAILKVMIGAFICPILFLSARQVSVNLPVIASISQNNRAVSRYKLANWWRKFFLFINSLLKGKDRPHDPSPMGFVFRLLTALLVILIATTLSQTFALPNLSLHITTAVYWLILVGLTTLMITEDPMKVGHGLLTVLIGFDLFYTTVEQSFLLTGLWGATNLLVALAIGYLIVAKGTGPEEEL